MSSGIPTVYGDPLAGNPINLGEVFKKPLVICRLVSMLLSIIVFSTIASGGWFRGRCILNGMGGNCHFVTLVGVVSLFLAAGYVVSDVLMSQVSSVARRKHIVVSDLVLASVFELFWVISMFVIIVEWWKTPDRDLKGVLEWQYRNIQAAASFSIFSVGIWALIIFFAIQRYRLGGSNLFDVPSDVNRADNRGFASFPGGASAVVSGGGQPAPPLQDVYMPYSVSAQMDDGSARATEHKTVLY